MAKVLLVEDNDINRTMILRRLTKLGYEVVAVSDGQQGIDMALSEIPDVIVLDMSLPIVDGWDVARNLKSNSATKDIPIIALSAHAMEGDREKALGAGCDDYDTKPVDFNRLRGKIEKLLATG